MANCPPGHRTAPQKNKETERLQATEKKSKSVLELENDADQARLALLEREEELPRRDVKVVAHRRNRGIRKRLDFLFFFSCEQRVRRQSSE